MSNFEDRIILAVDSHHGQFIPQVFIEEWGSQLIFDGEALDLEAILTGPDDENYWEEWCRLLGDGRVLINGERYYIVENEDLWLINEDEAGEVPEDWWI